MRYSAIFFDWDGVITDSVNIKTEAYVQMFEEYGKEVQEKVRKHHLHNGGMSRFEKFKLYYKTFLGIELDEQKTTEFANEFSNLVMKKVLNAPFIENAIETIENEYSNGVKLFIITGTPTEEIEKIAETKGLKKYFVEILGSPTSKNEWVSYILNKYKFNPQKCLFIGDAMTDYNAAVKNNVNFLGIKIKGCETEFPISVTIKDRVEIL